MARRPPAAAQAAAASLRTSIPPVPEASDDDMADVPPSGPATPQEDEGDEHEQDEQDPVEDEEDDPGTPANDSEALSRPLTPARGQSSVPRKRRLGRPPKNRPPDWDAPDDHDTRDAASDTGTPRKRGGWRGRGFGGGRWGRARGGPSHVTQVPVDKEGNMANVRDDEVELPEDPEGETKVDKMGRLQDGREYRVRVFTISGKGNRLYMLSTEPARCIGFRDSYLFFQKHRQLYKIILAEEAKRDLIERSIIPHSYKGRAIGVVTARSVFREFGARIVIGGRKVIDDYQVAAARANGDVEGELAVPDDKVPGSGETYDKNRYVAWHGASSVYHSGAPSVPMPNGKAVDGKKRKVIVTGVNWMFEHAREASRFNSALTANRRQNSNGIYDTHTNTMQYPRIMQPTHARWEQLPTPATGSRRPRITATGSGGRQVNGSLARISSDAEQEGEQRGDSIFPDMAAMFTRNFMICDTYLVTPPLSGLGIPGPDGEVLDIGPGGLADVPDHMVSELPEPCRQAFELARAEERKWKGSWGTEDEDGARAQLRISYNT